MLSQTHTKGSKRSNLRQGSYPLAYNIVPCHALHNSLKRLYVSLLCSSRHASIIFFLSFTAILDIVLKNTFLKCTYSGTYYYYYWLWVICWLSKAFLLRVLSQWATQICSFFFLLIQLNCISVYSFTLKHVRKHAQLFFCYSKSIHSAYTAQQHTGTPPITPTHIMPKR